VHPSASTPSGPGPHDPPGCGGLSGPRPTRPTWLRWTVRAQAHHDPPGCGGLSGPRPAERQSRTSHLNLQRRPATSRGGHLLYGGFVTERNRANNAHKGCRASGARGLGEQHHWELRSACVYDPADLGGERGSRAAAAAAAVSAAAAAAVPAAAAAAACHQRGSSQQCQQWQQQQCQQRQQQGSVRVRQQKAHNHDPPIHSACESSAPE